MHVNDPQLTAPADDTRLWRYQTFDKFIQLLEGRALWFARADQFEDRFEMAVPTRDLPAARAGLLNSLLSEPIIKEKVWDYLIRFAGLTRDELDAMPDDQLAALLPRFSSRFAYISSWNRNDAESAGLWAQFTGAGNGVAVRTTARALREVVDAGCGDRKFLLAEVRYLDYRTESWGTWHEFSNMFHKRRAFAYEQEVRAVIAWPHWDDLMNGSVDPSSMPDLSGLAIPVDLDGLIRSVVVSPHATGWFVDLVASVLRRYGLHRVPITSELTEEPDW